LCATPARRTGRARFRPTQRGGLHRGLRRKRSSNPCSPTCSRAGSRREHLTTQSLAERFGVSHTPIREALIALAGIGIIDLLPNRRAIVRKVSANEVREVCQVRRVLECEATRSACGRIELAELKSLAVELQRLMTEGFESLTQFIAQARAVDSRLHDLIAESCGNVFLAQEIGRLKTLFRAFRDGRLAARGSPQ